jgi:hypothetical protein
MRLQIRLREQTVDRLKKEVTLLRKRLYNMSKDKGERAVPLATFFIILFARPNLKMLHCPLGVIQCFTRNMKNSKESMYSVVGGVDVGRYFLNYAVGVKMNLYIQGRSCNVHADQLYEQALAEGIVDVEGYADFIDNKMATFSEPIPM